MPRKPTGRRPDKPTAYTPELGDAIATRIASGESLRAICKGNGMPDRSTVLRWVLRGEGGFRDEEALRLRAEGWAEELVELADEALDSGDATTIQATRVALDARKWCASRLLPKKYGDRAALEVGGQAGNPLTFIDFVKRAASVKEPG